MNKHVLKQSSVVELFNDIKYSKSIAKTLQAAGVPKNKITPLTTTITHEAHTWLANKSEVSSTDIYAFTCKSLSKHNKMAGLLYKNYREIW
jgi:transcriptional regulator NrdR family protein